MSVARGTVEVVMPAMGDSVAEGTVLEWRKQVGDQVEVDETLVEISTDKVDAEVPSPVAGTVSKINVAEGDIVSVGHVIGRMSVGDGSSATAQSGQKARDTPAGAPPSSPDDAPGSGVGAAGAPGGVEASSVSRRIAASEGIDLARVRGSARSGRITKADVLAAAGNGARTEAPPSA